MTQPDTPRTARFWSKVELGEGCWLWRGATNRHGYGIFGVLGRSRMAHRIAYELSVGPIPEGLTIDHLCRNHACVRPGHLEPVTNKENILRGISPSAIHARTTHCPQGHPYDARNTRIRRNGKRACLACEAVRSAQRRLCPECELEVSAKWIATHLRRIHLEANP